MITLKESLQISLEALDFAYRTGRLTIKEYMRLDKLRKERHLIKRIVYGK